MIPTDRQVAGACPTCFHFHPGPCAWATHQPETPVAKRARRNLEAQGLLPHA